MAGTHISECKHTTHAQGEQVDSPPADTETQNDPQKTKLAEEVASLKSEVKKWKAEAEDAK